MAQFVEDLGGGFLLTGGERSFGVGGYFKSPLDAILPVSMELRHEHRKNRVAIAIALDRSGSMAVPIGRGKTKMDLADLGTAECVRLLSAGDMVSVIAVDTVPHIIQPMGPVEDPEAICRKVLRIESAGGGIYIYEALVAAGEQLTKAEDYSTRHIILFADANDSEKPDDYKTLIKKFADGGITVSVIGLGTDHDSDSELLKDIAKSRGRPGDVCRRSARTAATLYAGHDEHRAQYVHQERGRPSARHSRSPCARGPIDGGVGQRTVSQCRRLQPLLPQTRGDAGGHFGGRVPGPLVGLLVSRIGPGRGAHPGSRRPL